MKLAKKYREEYRRRLLRQPFFWVGGLLIVLSFILYFTNVFGYSLFLLLFLVGFALVVFYKYRLINELEKKN